ncbi:hypothetical protein [Crocinitomix catalasitica]|uniref:hypothetical protein n=1 Tax=Crocinitomix catalasitica TaxID=184607 RepID=UPI00047F38AA|nr:hypothetical protein [Crocinitomix catalasitica]
MKFSLSPLVSDVFILIYITATLYIRFKLENQVALSTLTSVFVGLIFVLILWVMIKTKVLNPNWFGLFKKRVK